MRAKVTALVKEEMGSFPKPEYLAAFPGVPEVSFGGSAVLQAEYARVAAGQPRAAGQGVTLAHFVGNTPPSDEEAESPAAWQRASDAVRVRLEAQVMDSMNLELLSKYGTPAWKVAAGQAEGVAGAAQAALSRVQASAAEVNQARRITCEHKGVALAGARRQWNNAVDSSFQLRVAVAELEGKVAGLRAAAAAKGLTADGDGDVSLD